MDIVIGQGACTNSVLPSTFGTPGLYAPIADYTLLQKAVEAAEEHKAKFMVGNILSSDNFYAAEGQSANDLWKRMSARCASARSPTTSTSSSTSRPRSARPPSRK